MGAGKVNESNIVISYLANKKMVEHTPGLCYYLDDEGMAIYENGVYIGHVHNKIGKDIQFFPDGCPDKTFPSAMDALRNLLEAKNVEIPFENL